MKVFHKILFLSSILCAFVWFSNAQSNSWAGYWSSPIQVLDSVVDRANITDDYQRSALDGVTDLQGSFKRSWKLSNTLDYIRQNVWPILQRGVYFWLVLSTIWLIICWLLIVTWWITKVKWLNDVKWKIVNALLAVFFLSWFYVLIDLVVGVTNTIFTP